MKKLLALAITVVFILAASPCWGDIPHLINYQGMLTDDGGNPLNTPQNLTFRIYNDSTSGTQKWGETHNNVPVNNGLFSVILGSAGNPVDLPFDEDYWLEIEVGVYDTLLPRVRLTSVGYAYRAKWADTSDYSFQAQKADTADYATLAVAAVSDSDWTISGNDIYSAVSGNVGIGTSSPTAPLTIQPVNGADIEFGGGAFNADIVADREFRVGTSTTHPFEILTNNQIRLWAGSVGNIGIGTTSPAAKLEVYYDNTNSNSAAIAIDNGTGPPRQDVLDFKFGGVTEARIRKATNGELYFGTLDNKGITFRTNATNRMAITYAGDVGIGTISPDEQLHVTSDTGKVRIDGSVRGRLIIGDYNDATDQKYFHVQSNGSLMSLGRFLETTSTMYYDIAIDRDGEVGIGIGNPSEKLHVNGKVYVATMDPTTSGNDVRWYNNRLYYYSSSQRYKEDIQPLEENFSKILQAEPKSFIDKVSGERNIGFIAEEFDELGLNNLVNYRDGEPDALKYELVSLYLLEVVKDLKAKNEELEKRLETLESRE